MTSPRTLVRVLVLITVVTALVLPLPVAAQEEDEDEDEDGGTVVNIELDAVVDAIEDLIDEVTDFTGDWDQVLKEVLTAVLFQPFRLLAQQLIQVLASVLANTPTIHPNPAVEEVHRLTLITAYTFSGLVFAAAGLLHMIGPVLGVSYREVRLILPRVVTGLVFASVSLPLLQYTVELSDALVQVFMPQDLTMSLSQLAGLSVALVLVWVVESALLLVLVVMFIIRNVYLLFVAAISPLLALAWSLPRVKRYADTFIAGYWTALAMAPLDVLVLRFVFALLKGNGATGVQSISNWVLGVAGFTLLIFVPYQLYGASQAAVGQAYLISRGVKNRVQKHQYNSRSQRRSEDRVPRRQRRRSREPAKYRGGDD